MSAPEVLDFDVLVRKHVRIVPTCRIFQLSCWLVLSAALFLLAFVAIVVIADFLWFGLLHISRLYYATQDWPVFDFTVSRHIIEMIRSGELVYPGWQTVYLIGVFVAWPLSVFVALSLISFQLDRFVLAALPFLLLYAGVAYVTPFVHESLKWEGAIDQSLSPIISDAWSTGVEAYVWLFAFLSLRQMLSTSAPERNILREGATSVRFSGSTLLHVFGIPPNIRNSARRVRTALLAYLANLIGTGPVFLFFLAGFLIFSLFWAAAGPSLLGWYDPTRNPIAEAAFFTYLIGNIVTFALVLLSVFLMIAVFRVVGNAGLRMSRRFMRVSLEQAQAVDQRRPVLFLRSFSDDAVVLTAPPSGFAYKLFGSIDRKKSLDELLLEEGTTFGPVVALGNPNDAVPPYGAARGYAKHSDWQKMVSDLMDAAVAIVICVDETPSLWWEIDHVNRKAYLTKTLLLLHPKFERQDSAPEVIGKFDQMFGLSIAGMGSDRGRPFGLWLDPAQGLRVGLASRFSRAHYLLMLRWFLRSRIKESS
jgi:hypothetical protein